MSSKGSTATDADRPGDEARQSLARVSAVAAARRRAAPIVARRIVERLPGVRAGVAAFPVTA
jgi:hypothetical protein